MVEFQIANIPRILPEILLIVLALLVLGSDIFERWGTSEDARLERSRSSGSLAMLGLGMIFIITLVQSGFVGRIPVDFTSDNPIVTFFVNIIRNLQYGTDPIANTPVPIVDLPPILGAFSTDTLTMLSRLIFVGAALLTVLLTLDVPPLNNPGEFYTLLLISTTGMAVMSGATELILAFIAIELTSIPLYVLVGYFTERRQSSEGGMKYFLFGAMSSGILLYGMSLLYGYTVTALASADTNIEGFIGGEEATQFARIGEVVAQAGDPVPMLIISMLFIIGGLGYKIAVVPFHSWSPDAYQVAPTAITAFLSTASKVAGFILLYRLLVLAYPSLVGAPITSEATAFGGWTGALALIALVTLVWGNLAALPQTNAKRLLAYSGIGHAGFLLLGLLAWAAPTGTDQALGTSALVYYLVVYTLMNVGAFGVLAVVSLETGGDDISDLNGLAQRNLGLAVLMTVFIFSLAGIPPLAGFFAKFYIFMAGWQSGAEWLVVVGVIMTIVSLYYYLLLLKAIFLNPPLDTTPISTPPSMQTALLIGAVLTLALGIYPNAILNVINEVTLVAAGG